MDGPFVGDYEFNNSDVLKRIEGAAYSLQNADPELDAYIDTLIAKIAAAQEPDGYLYTPRTIDPHAAAHAGTERWSSLTISHELYNSGHMFEAATAHFQATGKRNFLDIALKNADLLVATFGPDGLRRVPGHQEVELGLVKLYRATGEAKYLELAKFFLDGTGSANGRELMSAFGIPGYMQDHLPVIEQREAVGHAVRATYMYSAMADVAALTRGDQDYIDAIQGIWDNVVQKKLALHGGIGAEHHGEAFGENYELPNPTSYNETCASIANIFWNHRLFLLTGQARYIDVMERILYNGFLVGVSMEGDKFFYVNPLEWDGEFLFNRDNSCTRQPLVLLLLLPDQRRAAAAFAAGLPLRRQGRSPVRQPVHHQRGPGPGGWRQRPAPQEDTLPLGGSDRPPSRLKNRPCSAWRCVSLGG